jgi:hypothetical protein
VRLWLVATGAVLALGGAHFARETAWGMRPEEHRDEPFAPSPAAAPFVSLGYRELGADVQWVRLLGYFGGDDTTASGLADLVDSIVALDPRYERVYEYGARAITMAATGVDNAANLRAIAVLERGRQEFPDSWRIPYLAGQIYTQDLRTKDPAQRRAWDEKGLMLIEAAIRKPGAPVTDAMWAATMHSKLGQHEAAVKNLREMILLTADADARKRLIDRLAKLEDADADEIAGETYEQQHAFAAAWKRDRPSIPATMYVLLGPHGPAAFDPTDLATGGRDLVGADQPERLEPLE